MPRDNPHVPNKTFEPAAAWTVLKQRARLLRRVRQFFDARGFLEVETPVLSRDTVVDRHLEPLPVADPCGQEAAPWYLQTSPEFCMKRLLASMDADPDAPLAIYQITRAFRRHERGSLHNPEFTMVEWYEVDCSYAAGIDLVAEFAGEMFDCQGVARTTYAAAFDGAVGLDPHRAATEELQAAARAALRDACPELDPADRDGWIQLLFTECVEPRLCSPNPVVVYDYPAGQAALARVEVQEGVPIARRFELYGHGLELANGYYELLDADVLRQRTELVNQQRRADGKQTLPAENRLLDAMRHGLPPCTGVALGFDRLLMAICEVDVIQKVLAFPYDRA